MVIMNHLFLGLQLSKVNFLCLFTKVAKFFINFIDSVSLLNCDWDIDYTGITYELKALFFPNIRLVWSNGWKFVFLLSSSMDSDTDVESDTDYESDISEESDANSDHGDQDIAEDSRK